MKWLGRGGKNSMQNAFKAGRAAHTAAAFAAALRSKGKEN